MAITRTAIIDDDGSNQTGTELNNAWKQELYDQIDDEIAANPPRVTTIASSATPTINTDNCNCVTITALAADITSMTTNLSGTPVNFQKLMIRIKDNGTARAITWGAKFEAVGVALPTTTVISKRLTVGFIYDTVTAKWGCVASVQEA